MKFKSVRLPLDLWKHLDKRAKKVGHPDVLNMVNEMLWRSLHDLRFGGPRLPKGQGGSDPWVVKDGSRWLVKRGGKFVPE